MRRNLLLKRWVIIVACCVGCSSDTDTAVDSGNANSSSSSNVGNDDAAADEAVDRDLTIDAASGDLPVQDAVEDSEPELRAEDFVGTWRLLRMECPQMDPITFVDYDYVLKLEQTKGTALDATTSCTLTTEDFPIVETVGGFDLQYENAASLSCDPSPCTLTMKTKIGADVTEESYSCPADFPISESPRETIVAVEGTTLRTWYASMMCKSFYERVE